MGAWNYPFDLTLNPLAGAIGAGNTAIIKPSEVPEASAKMMLETLPKYLDKVILIRYMVGNVLRRDFQAMPYGAAASAFFLAFGQSVPRSNSISRVRVLYLTLIVIAFLDRGHVQ